MIEKLFETLCHEKGELSQEHLNEQKKNEYFRLKVKNRTPSSNKYST